MRLVGFHHFALQVIDLERMCAFYRETLGLPELTRHFRPDGSLRSVWLTVPESGFIALEAVDAAEVKSTSKNFVLAFKIRREERARVAEELAQVGIQIDRETRWTVFFRDPEGNRLGLSHHPSDPL